MCLQYYCTCHVAAATTNFKPGCHLPPREIVPMLSRLHKKDEWNRARLTPGLARADRWRPGAKFSSRYTSTGVTN
jgi:hypothetical protein